jgi:hypothetical protein
VLEAALGPFAASADAMTEHPTSASTVEGSDGRGDDDDSLFELGAPHRRESWSPSCRAIITGR